MTIDRNPSLRKLRQFGALCVLAAVIAGFTRGPWWLLAPAAIGTAWPALLRPVFVGASIVTYPIGWLVSRVVLAAIFFGLVTPLGIVFRLAGRDRLGLRSAGPPRWIEKTPPRDPRSYFDAF